MRIQIDPHTLERAEERGTNGEEIKDVIDIRTPHSREVWDSKVYGLKSEARWQTL
jgi:hypothetical protein